MSIFAAQHAFSSWMCVVVSCRGDIDEQPTVKIHPSRVNNVQLIRLLSVDVVRVDLQHIISAFWDARRLVVENGHVVVGGKVLHRRFGDLNIGVGIPG